MWVQAPARKPVQPLQLDGNWLLQPGTGFSFPLNVTRMGILGGSCWELCYQLSKQPNESIGYWLAQKISDVKNVKYDKILLTLGYSQDLIVPVLVSYYPVIYNE